MRWPGRPASRARPCTSSSARAPACSTLLPSRSTSAGYPGCSEAVRVPDPRDTLRGGITAGVHIFAAYRDVFRALYSMEELEKEATGGAISRVEENRPRGWCGSRAGSRHKQLRPSVKIAEAAHVLWIAASFEAFDLLYTGRASPPTRPLGSWSRTPNARSAADRASRESLGRGGQSTAWHESRSGGARRPRHHFRVK